MNHAVQTNQGDKKFDTLPSQCPFCHKSIIPNTFRAHSYGSLSDPNSIQMEIVFSCPNKDCNHFFIGYYSYDRISEFYRYLNKTSLGNLLYKQFSETIKNISSQFNVIYNQSYQAEQQNLLEICGVGYRKALEFLIKDYAVLNNPPDKDRIEAQLLGATISTYVTDDRIKSVAKRAAWLGNDETHYIRKWEGNNLQDLKILIELTIHWIEMEALTKSFSEEMPG